jgi:hypothetical protein
MKMSVNIEEKEKRTFWQWVSLLMPYIYTGGIVLISGWMLVALLIVGIQTISDNPKSLLLQGKTATTEAMKTEKSVDSPPSKTDNETWIDIVVKPITSSNVNKIIFRGLFLILVWVLVFLVIPVAFTRLRRFKFFSMEFEVESKEQAAIQHTEMNGSKAKLMAYLSSEDAAGKIFSFLRNDAIDYQEALEYFLEEIRIGYKKNFDLTFSYTVHNGNFPDEITDLINESKEIGEPVIRNKIDNDNLFKKNYLIYYFVYEGNELVTELSSYHTQFDIFDKYLIQLLHNVLNKNVENIGYVVALTNLSNNETENEINNT